MFGVGVQEFLLILLIAAFFFGGEKLPELAKGLGKGLRGFQRASAGDIDDEAAPAAPPPPRPSHGGGAGAGDQGEPAGQPHDRRGPGPG